MSIEHRDVGMGMHVATDAITPGTVVTHPREEERPILARCTCGSAWFTGDVMLSGDHKLVAYVLTSAVCVVCGRDLP